MGSPLSRSVRASEDLGATELADDWDAMDDSVEMPPRLVSADVCVVAGGFSWGSAMRVCVGAGRSSITMRDSRSFKTSRMPVAVEKKTRNPSDCHTSRRIIESRSEGLRASSSCFEFHEHDGDAECG
jgi:hypothetical protein